MIHTFVESTLQIFIVVMAFQTDNGVRHVEQMYSAFTTEEKCETYAKEVLINHHNKIKGLYWWCEAVPVNP